MRLLTTLLVLAIPALSASINFDATQPGTVPAGWTVAMTHTGGAPKWEVLKDPTAPSQPNVLAQTSADATDGRFPLAILDQASFKDGELSVRTKAIAGKVDQGAGLVWRYRDPNNYYLVRANALEDNVVLYKVLNGRRTSIAPKGTAASTYGMKHKVPSKTWNTLRVTFNGPVFTVYFNGDKLFDVEDSTFATPGKVGLWTKADSVIYFDDFDFTQK
jgi:3-keto-disaccharide hydrolase